MSPSLCLVGFVSKRQLAIVGHGNLPTPFFILFGLGERRRLDMLPLFSNAVDRLPPRRAAFILGAVRLGLGEGRRLDMPPLSRMAERFPPRRAAFIHGAVRLGLGERRRLVMPTLSRMRPKRLPPRRAAFIHGAVPLGLGERRRLDMPPLFSNMAERLPPRLFFYYACFIQLELLHWEWAKGGLWRAMISFP